MSAIVLLDPEITGDIVTGGTPAGSPVDLSCHIQSVDIGADVDTVDVGTFCNPGAQVSGAPSYTVDLTWRVQDDTASVVAPFLGQSVLLTLKPSANASQQLTVQISFGSVNPATIGTWEAGGAIESASSHGAETAPAWGSVT